MQKNSSLQAHGGHFSMKAQGRKSSFIM